MTSRSGRGLAALVAFLVSSQIFGAAIPAGPRFGVFEKTLIGRDGQSAGTLKLRYRYIGGGGRFPEYDLIQGEKSSSCEVIAETVFYRSADDRNSRDAAVTYFFSQKDGRSRFMKIPLGDHQFAWFYHDATGNTYLLASENEPALKSHTFTYPWKMLDRALTSSGRKIFVYATTGGPFYTKTSDPVFEVVDGEEADSRLLPKSLPERLDYVPISLASMLGL